MNYKRYINSKKWLRKSKEFIALVGKCEKCGSGYNLTCHHKNYNHLGQERIWDIMVLCWNCHKKYHIRKNIYSQV